MEKMFYSIHEVANVLEVSVRWLRGEVKKGNLTVYDIAQQHRFKISDIHEFIENKKIEK